MIYIPTPIEGVILFLLVLLLLRSFGWTLKFKREKDMRIMYTANPLHPGGGFFEFPDDSDPAIVKAFFSGAGQDVMRPPGEVKAPSANGEIDPHGTYL